MARPTVPGIPAAPRDRAAQLLLALLAVLPFAGALALPLVYDDVLLVARNASVHRAAESLPGALALFGQEYWHGVDSGSDVIRFEGQALYRPLPLLLWAAAGRLGLALAGSTVPFHLLGLLAHLAVVLLLHRWLRRLGAGAPAAFAGAALFAVHPLHTEAVAYVGGLPDVLATLSVVAGLLLLARREGEGRRWLAVLGPGACLFLGLLAKETAILLVPLAVLFELVRRPAGAVRPAGRAAVFAGLGVALALHLLLRVHALGQLLPRAGGVSYLDNPLMFAGTAVRLSNGLRLALLPAQLFLWPARLSADYSFDALPLADSPWAAPVLVSAAVLAAAVLFGARQLGRRPLLGWGLLACVGCALFTSQALRPIGTLFGERLAYLPDVGLCVAIAGLVQAAAPWLEPRAERRVGAAILLAVAVAGLGAAAAARTQDFQSTRRLFESAAQARPGSARVHFVLGQLDADDGRLPEAEAQFREALHILPGFYQAAIGLGDVRVKLREPDKALAMYDAVLGALPAGEPGSQPLRAAVLGRRAVARALAGDEPGALADLDALAPLASDPAWPGRFTQAADALRRAARGEPEAARALLAGAEDPFLVELAGRLPQD
jgi:protein O-mannosyl-transferase